MTQWDPEILDSRAKLVFQGVIPDLASKRREYVVDTSEVDESSMAIFGQYIRTVIPSLELAVAGQREADIRRVAHSLLGAGGTIGVPTLSAVARELSDAASQGDFNRCAVLKEGLMYWLDYWNENNGDPP